MRRPLLALATAFGAGCLVADPGAGWPRPWPWPASCWPCWSWRVLAPRRSAARALGAAAFALGALAAQVEVLSFEDGSLRQAVLEAEVDELPVRLTGTVRGDARPRLDRLRLTLDVERIHGRGGLARRRGACRWRWPVGRRSRRWWMASAWRCGHVFAP